ncbi:MAG: flippase [Candidatus Shapirobacteria bacterium]|jgi:O-antigen/teichoic acid export membrane protein
MEKTIVNTITQIAGKVVTVVISLVTTSLLTRRLGVEVFGKYVFITAIFIFFDVLADFGTKIIGVKEASSKDSEKEKIFIWQNIGSARIVMSLAAIGIGLIAIWKWEGFLGVRIEALMALMMVVLTSIAGTLEMIWQTKMRFEWKVVIDIIFPGLFLIAIANHGGVVSLKWVFGVYLLARAITLGIGIIKERKVLRKWKFRGEAIKGVLRASWPMGLYLIVFVGYDRAVDSIMIDRFLGAREVAWYGLSYKIYATLIQPAYFFVNSVFPLLASARDNKREIFWWASKWLFWGAVIIAAIVLVKAEAIIMLLAGPGFERSAKVLQILMGALVVSFFNHLTGFSLITKNGQKEMLGIAVTVLSFNFGANYLVIPRAGIEGAAIVTVATELISGLLVAWRLKKKIT